MEVVRKSISQNEELEVLNKSLQGFINDKIKTEKITIQETHGIPSFLMGECLFTQCVVPMNSSSSTHQRIGVWKCLRKHNGCICQKYAHVIDGNNAILFDEPIDTIIVDPSKKFQPAIGRTAANTEYLKNENCVYRKEGGVANDVWAKFRCMEIHLVGKRCTNAANGSYDSATEISAKH